MALHAYNGNVIQGTVLNFVGHKETMGTMMMRRALSDYYFGHHGYFDDAWNNEDPELMKKMNVTNSANRSKAAG